MDPSAMFRHPPRRRPGLRDILPPVLGVLGFGAFLAGIVFIILLANGMPHK